MQHEAVVDETTGAVSDGGVIVRPPTGAAFRGMTPMTRYRHTG